MKFPSEERFLQYCISKRRTYLRQLFERRNPRGFYDLWQGELVVSRARFEVAGVPRARCRRLGRELRWLLLQDLHRIVRNVVPEFAPAPPSVLSTLPGAMHQVRAARSMLIAGEPGVGKEQLAILLHVLSGRPGALVRVAAGELGHVDGTPTRQLMPERGSVFISDFETLAPHAQDDLLAFLNGDARRRDLLFFVATRAEPRELVARSGIRRDLFVRVSQTEVRLPNLGSQPDAVTEYVADVVYDLIRIPPDELAKLRKEAEGLAVEWRLGKSIPMPAGYDFVSEALSYVLWDARRVRATSALGPRLDRRLSLTAIPENFLGLRMRVARALDDLSDASAYSDQPTAPADDGRTDATLEATRAEARAAPLPTYLDLDGLLRAYYVALLDEEGGNVVRVARRAARPISAVQAELDRLGLRADPPATSRD